MSTSNRSEIDTYIEEHLYALCTDLSYINKNGKPDENCPAFNHLFDLENAVPGVSCIAIFTTVSAIGQAAAKAIATGRYISAGL